MSTSTHTSTRSSSIHKCPYDSARPCTCGDDDSHDMTTAVNDTRTGGAETSRFAWYRVGSNPRQFLIDASACIRSAFKCLSSQNYA
eukprot:scaffold177251_cov25-Prasinocladus_malaysianus.AAC.1